LEVKQIIEMGHIRWTAWRLLGPSIVIEAIRQKEAKEQSRHCRGIGCSIKTHASFSPCVIANDVYRREVRAQTLELEGSDLSPSST
jgi:hypothetical protein